MPEKTVSEIVLGRGVAAWQAHCLHCDSAYLIAHREQTDEARARYCVVCGELAVYVRLDGHR
jgi:hypothetical protein